jgi:hypothetical protein
VDPSASCCDRVVAKLTSVPESRRGRRLEPEITKTKSATANIAAICTDTWGCEVRPNETKEANQPWHWVVIPAIGISMG